MSTGASKNAIRTLRILARQPEVREACELCGVTLMKEHSHLLRLSDAHIACACEPCTILFSHRSHSARFIRIPTSARRLSDFQISAAEWSALLLPIDLAFFLKSTPADRVVAYYPSPAGATESRLDLDAWGNLVRANPVLEQMLPDVEALLVNRTRDRQDYFIAPIDQCYKLTGLIRTHWHGLSGGPEVWQQIEAFFGALGTRAVGYEECAHA